MAESPWVQFPLQENVSPLGEGCARALLSPSSFDILFNPSSTGKSTARSVIGSGGGLALRVDLRRTPVAPERFLVVDLVERAADIMLDIDATVGR